MFGKEQIHFLFSPTFLFILQVTISYFPVKLFPELYVRN
jgi:hypothetical protein